MDSLLTRENMSENGSRSIEVESSPEFKRNILTTSKVMENLQRGMRYPTVGVPNPAWKGLRPADGLMNQQITKFNRHLLELGSSQRPTLSLRPADSAMRQVENVLQPPPETFMGSGGTVMHVWEKIILPTDRAISDEEVQSTFRSSPLQYSSGHHNNEGLESIFSFNYETIPFMKPMPTSTFLPSTSAGNPSSVGFLASPQYLGGQTPNYNPNST